mgnify:CR=1 FL=1
MSVAALKLRRVGSVDAAAFLKWSIGEDLRKAREGRGLTQAEVARRARMRREVLSRLEAGRGNPTVRTVQRVLRAMGYRA